MLKKILRLFTRGSNSIESLLPYPEGKRIYREFHNLRRELMDQEALKVIGRLNKSGYKAYLVGGCVRDLILARRPKDFDVVTNATPQQIRKLFSNSRLIGRRFKIVHVIFRGGKVIEVSTFRSLPNHRFDKKQKLPKDDLMMRRDNEFGSAVEDAARRDFTINSLYYDPRNDSIIDYTGGYEDIKQKRIKVIGDAEISFQEDPVRMLRAAKFAALLGFQIDSALAKAIKKHRDVIAKASPMRMLEEYNKIFRTGKTAEIFRSFYETGLLRSLFPELSFGDGEVPFAQIGIGKRLMLADKMLSEREELTTNAYFALMCVDLVPEVFTKMGRLKNIAEYVRNGVSGFAKRLQLPGKDKDRLIQIFISQARFMETKGSRQNKPEFFRQKIFFYEAFMVFKIQALVQGNDDAVQKAMFWEIGPRMRPPESSRLISLFPNRNRNRFNSGGGDRNDRQDRDRRPDRNEDPDRNERNERQDRGDRQDRNQDRNERQAKGARQDRNEPQERSDRPNRNEGRGQGDRQNRRDRNPEGAPVGDRQPSNVGRGETHSDQNGNRDQSDLDGNFNENGPENSDVKQQEGQPRQGGRRRDRHRRHRRRDGARKKESTQEGESNPGNSETSPRPNPEDI